MKPSVLQTHTKTGRRLLWSGPRKTDDTVIIIHFVSSSGSFNKAFCDGQSISSTEALISHFPNGDRINCQNRSGCISIGIVRRQLIDDQCIPITWLFIQLCANRRQLPIITLFIIGWSLQWTSRNVCSMIVVVVLYHGLWRVSVKSSHNDLLGFFKLGEIILLHSKRS